MKMRREPMYKLWAEWAGIGMRQSVHSFFAPSPESIPSPTGVNPLNAWRIWE